jgi:mono/diheme cytochrome c family protein
MKKVARYLVIGMGVLLVAMLVTMCAVILVSKNREARTYAIRPEPIERAAGDEALSEGKRLFFARGCADCHAEDGTGKVIVDAAVGRFVGTNLSRVVRERSDEDLLRAIRHGISAEGKPLVLMPSKEYNRMSNREVARIIAFLRTLKPSKGVEERCEVRPLGRLLHVFGKMNLFNAEDIDHDETPPPAPEPAETVEYGAYLAIGCMSCHGERLSGGPIPGAPVDAVGIPKNLTLHESGLKSWTKADFARAVREGKRPDGAAINPKFMPWTTLSHMSDVEVGAIWTYLESLEPLPFGGR